MNDTLPVQAPAPNPGKQPKPQPWPVRFILATLRHVVLAGFALGCAGLFVLLITDSVVMPLLLQSGSEISAPALVGKPLEEAERIAESLGVRIQPDSSEYNNNYDANTISFQYPFSGTSIKPGRRIKIRVSLGPRPVEMPSVVGRSRRDAELVIKRYGLMIARHEWVHSNDYVRGMVARQEPEGGLDIPENADVVLYISDGLPETNVVMPRLVELGLSAALDTLLTYGFNLEHVRTHTEEAPNLLPETVIDQHPDPGAETNTDTEVDLIISASP